MILVRRETNPDDLEGMIAAAGILTSRGGKTSHAAVVARGMGKTCVCGAEELDVDVGRAASPAPATVLIAEGDVHLHRRLDRRGVRSASSPVVPSPVAHYLEHGPGRRARRGRRRDRRAGPRRRPAAAARRPRPPAAACAPTPTPPRTPRGPGTSAPQGIGLCRTEHMFLGDRRVLIERVILADSATRERDAALDALLPLQRDDFIELLDGDGRAADARSGCSTRRCTSSCPTAPS